MTGSRFRCIGAVAALIGLCAALSACLLSPGKFASQLDVRRDGRFTYSYTGEIYLLALSKLAAMGRSESSTGEFVAQPCYKEDAADERECTAEERATQRRDWEAQKAESADKAKRDADAMKAMLGGIDPADPKAAQELAARLRRQAGWKRVDYKGDGLFDVEYSLAGRLDHDFTFPTLERFPMANAFVTLSLRNDGTVRMDAPGFAPAAGGDPFRGMMFAAALAERTGSEPTSMPELDGQFVLVTDAPLLANNTDEGPQADPLGQKLSWVVNRRTAAAPTALLRLDSR